MNKKVILIVSLLILAGIVSVAAFHGAFSTITVEKHKLEEMKIVYAVHTGDYSESGKVMNKLYYSLLESEKIETFRGIGIYFDDPENVEKSKLRAVLGCVIEPNDYSKVEDLKGKNYKIAEIPENESHIVRFPYVSKISIIIGLMKVYPVINEFQKENNIPPSPITELYSIKEGEIVYSLNDGLEKERLAGLLR